MTLPATDDFNRSTLGSNWTTVSGAFVIYNNDDVYPNSVSTECGAFWNADTFNADQYAQIAVAARGVSSNYPYIGVCVRCSSGPNYYMAYFGRSGEVWSLARIVAGVVTDLYSPYTPNWTVGDVIRLEAEGTTLRVLRNGDSVYSTTDSSLSSGSAGIAGYDTPSGSPPEVRADDWEGGNLGGGGAASDPAPRTKFRRLYALLSHVLTFMGR